MFSEALDLETTIGATRITIASQHDLVAELLTGEEECIEFEMDGLLSGTAILSFDETARSFIHGSSTDEDGIEDLAADMLDAFVEEWENYVGSELSVDSATYVPDPAAHDFGVEALTTETESTPLFQGSIDVVDRPGRVRLYLVPDADSMRAILSGSNGADAEASDSGMDEPDETAVDGVEDDSAALGGHTSLFDEESEAAAPLPLDKLAIFSDLIRAGTRAAADRATAFTGVETETEISGINFTPIDDISAGLEADDYVGTTIAFEGKPSGHLVILFPPESARLIAEEMLPTDPDGEELTKMHESALEELGNVMGSGFIDGWANVLQTTVDHTPPEFSDDMEMTILELVTEQLGPFQTHVYTIDSRITTDSVEFDCEIHALPNETQLSEALDELLVARRDQTGADPDEVF